jgi:radical SAM-linked protein
MRLRITFTKQDALRWTGHLDLHKSWERTIRRAGLPLAYSQGFHPQPKIQIAAALPLGFTSRCEMLDLFLLEDVSVTDALSALASAVPPGIEITSAETVDEKSPALQTQVREAEYVISLLDQIDPADLVKRINAVMSAESLPRERRGKQYDLRPLILSISPRPSGEGQGEGMTMRLAAKEGATGRPEEVLSSLNIAAENTRIERVKIIM